MGPTSGPAGSPGSIQNQVNGDQIVYGDLNFNSPPSVPAQTAEEQCLASLAFDTMNDRWAKISTPTAGTCRWLFQHKEWKRWLSARGGLMWIKGKPGSGKSTLLWCAEQELKNARVKKKDLALSFFFHGRGEELQRSPLGMYRSLLHQILKQEPASLSQLVETFQHKAAGEDEAETGWEWNPEHLGNFLDKAIYKILTSRTIWLFVDALDECGREGAEEVLQRFNRLARQGLFICVSCRHYPLHHWDGGFEITVEEQNKSDILRYAQSQLSGLKDKTAFSIPDLIASHSNGLFIWARLAIERLRTVDIEFGVDIEEMIKRTIDSIPHDLGQLYTGIVQRIEKTPAALSLFRWVTCAQRALSLDELWWALVVDSNAHADGHWETTLAECEALAMRNLRRPESESGMEIMVKTLGHGLVETVVSASGKCVVQFIHQTVTDFFRNGGLLLLDKDGEGQSLG